MDPAETVDAFIAAWGARDVDAAVSLAADDVVYENVGMSLTTGRDDLRSVISGFVDGIDEVDWVVHHQAAHGDVVMNERTDRFRRGDTWAEVRVLGIFVVRDGRIAQWRDYFDVVDARDQLARLHA